MEFVVRVILCLLILMCIFSRQGLGGGGGDGGDYYRRRHRVRRRKALFVFGDSYVDTGNIPFPFSNAQKFPYGITFPRKPTGRFSDGRVLTDFAAKKLGIKSPIPLRLKNKVGLKRLKEGINFGFGGSGVFDTSVPLPNMTAQIDMFQQLGSVIAHVVPNSIALVSVSANDYSFYLATNRSTKGLKEFIMSVVNQISINLKRMRRLGVKKIAITGLGPLGCYPIFTAPFSFKQCNQTINSFAQFHNFQLNQAVAKLNKQAKGSSSTVVVLDVYASFMSIIQNGTSRRNANRRPRLGIEFKTPLEPCCFGVSSEFSCGSVDEKGNKKFVLCEDPKSAFFWDFVHPTQQGWALAFSSFKFPV